MVLYFLSTIGTYAFIAQHYEATILATGWMHIPQRCTTRNTSRLAQWVGSATVFTSQTAHPVSELMGSAGAGCGLGYGLPDAFAELQTLDILGQIIQSADQAERVAKHRNRRLPEAGCYAEPGLLSKIDHNAICHLLNSDRDSGLPARYRSWTCPNLDSQLVALAKNLCPHVALVEFG